MIFYKWSYIHRAYLTSPLKPELKLFENQVFEFFSKVPFEIIIIYEYRVDDPFNVFVYKKIEYVRKLVS